MHDLKREQAFERSAAGATSPNEEPMVEYMLANITLMKRMIAEGYADARTLKRRISAMEDWIANGELLRADANAKYAGVIEFDLAEVTNPILACPNNPGDVKILSEVAGAKIDE